MKCNRALELLEVAAAGGEAEAAGKEKKNLLDLLLVDVVKGAKSSETPLMAKKKRLGEINELKKKLQSQMRSKETASPRWMPKKLQKIDPSYRGWVSEMEKLEVEEKGIRTWIIDTVQSSTEQRYTADLGGQKVHLTCKGREILETLRQRRSRLKDLELGEFIKELDRIHVHFRDRSKKAREILEIISPKLSRVEEIHLRLAAVGLSGHPGSAKTTAELFEMAFDGIEWKMVNADSLKVTLAESLVLLSKNKSELGANLKEANRLLRVPWNDVSTSEDQVRAVGILMACSGKPDNLVKLTQAISSEAGHGWYSPAAFIACAQCDRRKANGKADKELMDNFTECLQRFGVNPGLEPIMAAAIMASTGLPPVIVIQRYDQALEMMKKLNVGSMEVAAAMVAILPFDVEEAMDNIRLASQTVATNKLSLGGAENLSLGVKLLMQSSVMSAGLGGAMGKKGKAAVSSGMVPTFLALTGVAAGSAVAIGAGLLAFHELTLHSFAVKDFKFHPVHSHYVYG